MYKIIKHPGNLRFVEFFNRNNFHVLLSNYGASIYEIDTVDKFGALEAVTLSPIMNYYYNNPKFFGLTIGRVAGRIKDSKFNIGYTNYSLIPNEGNNLLHSGFNTLSHRFFDFDVYDKDEYTKVTYNIKVKHMEDGFPGNLELRVVYTLYKYEDKINLQFLSISDRDTILNITNHSYFNLSGNLKRDILNQKMSMNKELIGKMDDGLILEKFINVPKEYDFREEREIGKYFSSEAISTSKINGYDHIYSGKDNLHITLSDEISGRKLDITSSYKDVVIYTNNSQSNTAFLNSVFDTPYIGIAIEPQRYSNILKNGLVQKANALYNYDITYTFSLIGDKNDK